jgi:hypothetical protein
MLAFDQFSDWAVLFAVAYLTADALTHASRRTAEETARRIATVVVLSLIGSSILEVFYSEVSQTTAKFQGPVLTSAWIVSLFFIFGFSWSLYHRMLRHSHLVQSDRVNLVELVTKQVNGALIPMQKQISGLQETVDAEKASADQRSSKLTGAFDGLKKSIGEATRSINPLANWMELWNREIRKMMDDYREWAEAHKNDAATIHLLSAKLESLIDRAAVVEEELDELGSSHQHEGSENHADSEAGEGSPSISAPGTTGSVEPPHKLTREDGLANREKGNQALMRFCENLRKLNKDPKVSLLHGAPDLLFLYGDGQVRYVAAYKALTLSAQGSAKQRWIPRAKLVAELAVALKENKPLILFVENLANGRIWAYVIPVDEVKDFKGVTTHLMLVNDDPESEKACRDSLTSVLQLL